MSRVRIAERWVGDGEPTYFIADISANHDGDLDRARMLIRLCAEAGADAAKFQNFRAANIVSDYGFTSMGDQVSHQAAWSKSVFEVYQAASLPWDWTETLKAECDSVKIDYFSAPYDMEAVDMLDPHSDVFKIGSGDITWTEMLRKIASKGKTVILSTGASDIADVQRAVHEITAINRNLIVMQCNTNYTGSADNLKYVHLRVLDTYRVMFPDVVLGLSDHTTGHAAVLGAVALGAKAVEKHFTDDTSREGPDHPFSMTAQTWRDMVDRTRELEDAMGSADKQVVDNERATVVVQRRCLRASRSLEPGTVLGREQIDVLRPAPLDGIFPYDIDRVLGMRVRQSVPAGDYLRWDMLERVNV